MPTILPQDSNDNPIPALRLKSGGAHTISAASTSARNSTAFNADTRVVGVYASVPVYIAFGDDTVIASASDHYFPEGVYYDFSIGGEQAAHSTHMAVLRADIDGPVYVSEKE